MSSLYFRGKGARRYVWISYRKGLRRYYKPLGIKVDNPVKRSGRWVFPVEAVKLQRAIDLELRLGIMGISRPPKARRISEVLEDYLKDKEGTIAPGTAEAYRIVARAFYHDLGDPDIRSVMAEDVAAFRAKLLKEGRARNTAAKYMRHLSALFEYAKKKQLVPANIVSAYIITPTARPAQTFGVADLQAFFVEAAKVDPALYDQCLFLLLTGVRATDSCNLMWDEVDLKQRVIRLKNEKGRRSEMFPMDTALVKLLSGLKREDAFVFRFRDRFRFYRTFTQICARLGIENATLHQFKRTYVNTLYDSAADILTVSDLAHHTSINVTWAAYLKHRAMDKKRAALESSRTALAPILKRGRSLSRS